MPRQFGTLSHLPMPTSLSPSLGSLRRSVSIGFSFISFTLEKLNLYSLRKTRPDRCTFFVPVCRGFNPRIFFLEMVNLPVPIRNVRDFSNCSVCPSNKHCPARCAYAANAVGKDLDVFAIGAVPLNHI
jgi:hypothetical protein